MPAGEQIAFEPALALMLAEHFHHPAVRREVVVVGKSLGHPVRLVTSNTACQRFEPFSSGLKTRKLLAVHVQLHHVAQELPMTRVASAVDRARTGTATA